ncbi:hypothetical protein OF83DRAFT_1131884 [Amylostereum chailletii]|nr:hypothetical protein OF83DRAFT_1131884 [Amylostereum chailletii]
MPKYTRSKTGNLRPQKRKPESSTTTDDSDSSDDSGSEHQMPKARKSTAQPPKKRAKNNAAVPTVAQAVTRKKKGKLSKLPEMPLDILRDIFALLPPEDLVRLARATKALRQVLISREFDGIWRESFDHVPESPPRPPDVSYIGWAHIVYGGSFCHCCGKNSTSKIIFEFRKRMCSECAKALLVRLDQIQSPSRFHKRFTPELVRVYDIVPCAQSTVHGGHEVCERRTLSAVLNRLAEGTKNVADADESVFNAQLESLVQAEEQALEVYNEHAYQCGRWQDRLCQEMKDERKCIAYERRANIMARFLAMGYTKEDWGSTKLYSHKEVTVSRPLTEKVWTRILPILQPIIQEARDRNLGKERAVRRSSRYAVATALYPGVLAPLVHPMEFSLMPTASQCVKIKSISDFLDADIPEVDNAWRAELKKMFQTTVERVREDILVEKKTLAALLSRSDNLPEGVKIPAFDTGIGALDLARCVFQVEKNRYSKTKETHFGADVLSHTSRSGVFQDTNFQAAKLSDVILSARGSEIVQELLTLLGLPETTTALQLDDLTAHRRSVCTECSPSAHHQHGVTLHGLKALAWRAMVDHMLQKHSNSRFLDTFRSLTESELADVLPQEMGLRAGKRQWGCCHCPMDEKGPYWMCEEEASEHLKLKHKIAEPVENTDMFLDPDRSKVGAPCAIFVIPKV